MKRIRPAPMGRAFRYQRRLTHIIVSVAERAASEDLVTRVDANAAKATKPAKKTAGKGATESARKSKAGTKVKVKSAA